MLMKICLSINKWFIIIICSYTLTMTSAEKVEEQFYNNLDTLLHTTSATVTLILLGDFKARVGSSSRDRWDVTGEHFVGKMNRNELLLLIKYAEHEQIITNSL